MLLGFPEVGDAGGEAENAFDPSQKIREQNRKNKKSGGFQSMGLSQAVLNGILKKGYKVPTPIQRKTIPLILDNKDVVAMARTGSGKTACFLLPLFEKLKCRSGKTGARALVISPTRELCLQTLKFAKEIGKFTGLRYECVLGGDSIEKQFAAMHLNPDVIFATPGRFVHLCLEMSLQLTSVQYVVFDEADRLFEMGFGEQLREILYRLPESRQTVLFSATLPKMLVDFSKAGLNDPTLIRLDLETKVPETLKMAFFNCRTDLKDALLLYLLKDVISPDEQTVIFAATRHHVEYIQNLLEMANIPATFIFSNLDSAARKINVAKFKEKITNVLVVTDLAARGIDIPMLDNVINYHFPAKSKLFVHRVGRVARAGRQGTAYSFVGLDEIPYFIDLQLFLGGTTDVIPLNPDANLDWHRRIGKVPASVGEEYNENIRVWYNSNVDLQKIKKTAQNGYKQYLKSRPGASVESVKRSKELKETVIGEHPLLRVAKTDQDKAQVDLIQAMKNFRPKATIFEICGAKNKEALEIMSLKRKHFEPVIESVAKKRMIKQQKKKSAEDDSERAVLDMGTENDINEAFNTVVRGGTARDPYKKKKKEWKRDENYIKYESLDKYGEAGYALDSGFSSQARNASIELTADDDKGLRVNKAVTKWDSKAKKYVRVQDDNKKILTESGVYISATYKTDRYKKWMENNRIANQDMSDDEDVKKFSKPLPVNHPAMLRANSKAKKKHVKSEILRSDQILKNRKVKEKEMERLKPKRMRKKKNKK